MSKEHIHIKNTYFIKLRHEGYYQIIILLYDLHSLHYNVGSPCGSSYPAHPLPN
jgi:hypothetical protein